MARVLSDRDQFLGYAYVNPHALICARILSRTQISRPIRSAAGASAEGGAGAARALYSAPYYRLVFGESDGLPGWCWTATAM
jgi:23S rRNA (cytosine1962-C5)-methyltransferase